MRTILAPIVASIFANAASAQDAAPASYDGTWAVSGTSREGRELNAVLVLTGDRGTWRAYARSATAAKNNPCLMKTFPVTVQKSTAETLKFHVDGRAVIDGCTTFSATLTPIGSNTLDGSTGAGGILHIERK